MPMYGYAQSEQPAQPSGPTSTPTSGPLQLSGSTSQQLKKIFETLDLRLTAREKQIEQLQLSQSTSRKELVATVSSLEKASASLEQANKDNVEKDERIADLEGQVAKEAAAQRAAIAWWRTGALAAGGGLLGSALGWKGAAIGAGVGAAAGLAWAIIKL